MTTKTKKAEQSVATALSLAEIAASITGAAAPETVTDFNADGPASFTVGLNDAWAQTVQQSGIPMETVKAVHSLAENFEAAAGSYALDLIHNGVKAAEPGAVTEGSVTYTLPYNGSVVTVAATVDVNGRSMTHDMAVVRDTTVLCEHLAAHAAALFAS
ncbi:MAG: hypothetical protein ACKO0Z_27960 [Betaproteobacteria bacterium]